MTGSYEVCGLPKAGGEMMVLKRLATHEEAAAHALKVNLNFWDDVFVRASDRAMPKPPVKRTGPAPRPWRIVQSATFSNNGAGHLYVTDAAGRKIAAIWGASDEKLATAQLIVDAVNGETRAA